jgi:GDP-L-fucose synthase
MVEAAFAFFAELKPTHVIHLAAKVGGLYANQSQKVEFFRENVIMNDVVMECCKEFKVAKLVSCLSTCIFPDKVEYPLTEEKVHLGPPHASNVGYALAKRMIDTLNHCYNEEYGCNFTSIIPTNVYGKHDNFSIETGHGACNPQPGRRAGEQLTKRACLLGADSAPGAHPQGVPGQAEEHCVYDLGVGQGA